MCVCVNFWEKYFPALELHLKVRGESLASMRVVCKLFQMWVATKARWQINWDSLLHFFKYVWSFLAKPKICAMCVLRGYTNLIVITVPVTDKHLHCYKHKAPLHAPVILLHSVEVSICSELNVHAGGGGEESMAPRKLTSRWLVFCRESHRPGQLQTLSPFWF